MITQNRPYSMLDNETAIKIGLERLEGLDHSILWILIGIVNADGESRIMQKELAKMLHAEEASISRSVKRLVEIGIVEKLGTGVFKLSDALYLKKVPIEYNYKARKKFRQREKL